MGLRRGGARSVASSLSARYIDGSSVMPERAYQISTGVLLIIVLTIAYGGTFVLSVTRGNLPVNDLQRKFFRAGHAHAGVLVILGLLALTLEQLNHAIGLLWAGAAVLATGLISAGVGLIAAVPCRVLKRRLSTLSTNCYATP
jgi:hypothetical protein